MSGKINAEVPVLVTSYVENTMGQIIQVYINNIVVTLSKKYGFDPHEAKDYINSELAPEKISTEIDAYDFADDESIGKTRRKRQKAIDLNDKVVKHPVLLRKRNSNKIKASDLSLDFSKITLSPGTYQIETMSVIKDQSQTHLNQNQPTQQSVNNADDTRCSYIN